MAGLGEELDALKKKKNWGGLGSVIVLGGGLGGLWRKKK